MDEYIKHFREYIGFPEEIEINIHFFDSKDELYEKRIEMTLDISMKNSLRDNKYKNAEGCFIIPPRTNNSYDILLVCDGMYIYNLYHEIVHIHNLIKYRKKYQQDYSTIYQNTEFSNLDEFKARELSTVFFYTNIYQMSNMTYEAFIQEHLTSFIELESFLEKNIKPNEVTENKTYKYNLMQYMGFVSAVEILAKDKFVLPDFLKNNPIAGRIYRDMKSK